MSALGWITVEGFRSIRSIERLQLEPINVLVGANGAGKSNFIRVFSFLNFIYAGRLQYYVSRAGGADRLLHFGSRTTDRLTIDVLFESDRNRYRIALGADDEDGLFPLEETAYFWDKTKYQQPYSVPLRGSDGEAGISTDASTASVVQYVRDHLQTWRQYHFHDTSPTSPIKKPSDIPDNRRLRPDGSNLAAFLYYLRMKHEGAYARIRRTVRLVAPFFDDFILEPSAENKDNIRLEWRHRTSDAHFGVSSLSDGSLRFIALATLLLQPASLRPSVVVIDEPELGLHPYAITLLASLIKQASAETQIIAATQSPILLDHFDPQDVLVADRVHGATTIQRLDGEALASWLSDYSLGQLWEKNELGGRPSHEDPNAMTGP